MFMCCADYVRECFTWYCFSWAIMGDSLLNYTWASAMFVRINLFVKRLLLAALAAVLFLLWIWFSFTEESVEGIAKADVLKLGIYILNALFNWCIVTGSGWGQMGITKLSYFYFIICFNRAQALEFWPWKPCDNLTQVGETSGVAYDCIPSEYIVCFVMVNI